MLYPIIGYGHPTLRKVAQPIDKDYPNLDQLIADMYETMYNADGVGLAAPQIDLSIRLVVIGFRPYDEKTDTYGDPAEEHTLIKTILQRGLPEHSRHSRGCVASRRPAPALV